MVVGNQPNHRDHDVALTNLLETARKSSICLNYDKLAYKKTEVDFFGKLHHRWMQASSKQDLSNIRDASTNSKTQVKSFIGMVNYLSKFSARLSDHAELIRDLCKDKVPFNWGPENQDAFK